MWTNNSIKLPDGPVALADRDTVTCWPRNNWAWWGASKHMHVLPCYMAEDGGWVMEGRGAPHKEAICSSLMPSSCHCPILLLNVSISNCRIDAQAWKGHYAEGLASRKDRRGLDEDWRESEHLFSVSLFISHKDLLDSFQKLHNTSAPLATCKEASRSVSKPAFASNPLLHPSLNQLFKIVAKTTAFKVLSIKCPIII